MADQEGGSERCRVAHLHGQLELNRLRTPRHTIDLRNFLHRAISLGNERARRRRKHQKDHEPDRARHTFGETLHAPCPANRDAPA